MKKIVYTKQFVKTIQKRIKNNPALIKQFKTRIQLFLTDRKNRLLKDHLLKGQLSGYRSFCINGDWRIIYWETSDYFVFADIGTHKQVY